MGMISSLGRRTRDHAMAPCGGLASRRSEIESIAWASGEIGRETSKVRCLFQRTAEDDLCDAAHSLGVVERGPASPRRCGRDRSTRAFLDGEMPTRRKTMPEDRGAGLAPDRSRRAREGMPHRPERSLVPARHAGTRKTIGLVPPR